VDWLKRRYPHKSSPKERLMLGGLWVLLACSVLVYAWNLLLGLAAMLVLLVLIRMFNRMQKRRILGDESSSGSPSI
jgi:hypothetical protein